MNYFQSNDFQGQAPQQNRGSIFQQHRQHQYQKQGNHFQLNRLGPPRLNDMNQQFSNMNVNIQSARYQQSEPDIDNLQAYSTNSNFQNSQENRNHNQMSVSVPPFGFHQNEQFQQNQQNQYNNQQSNPFQSSNISIDIIGNFQNQIQKGLERELPNTYVPNQLNVQKKKWQNNSVTLVNIQPEKVEVPQQQYNDELLQRERDEIKIKQEQEQKLIQQQQNNDLQQQQDPSLIPLNTQIQPQQQWKPKQQYQCITFKQQQVQEENNHVQFNQIPLQQNDGAILKNDQNEKHQNQIHFPAYQNQDQFQNQIQSQPFKPQNDVVDNQKQFNYEQGQGIIRSNVNQLQVNSQNTQFQYQEIQYYQSDLSQQQKLQFPQVLDNHLVEQKKINQDLKIYLQKEKQQFIQQQQQIIQVDQQQGQERNLQKQPLISDTNKAILQDNLLDSATKLQALQESKLSFYPHQQFEVLRVQQNNEYENQIQENRVHINYQDQEKYENQNKPLNSNINNNQEQQEQQQYQNNQLKDEKFEIQRIGEDQNQQQLQRNEPQQEIPDNLKQLNQNQVKEQSTDVKNSSIVYQPQAQKQEQDQDNKIVEEQKQIQPQKEELTIEDAQFIDQNGQPIFKLNIFEQNGPVFYNPKYLTKEQKLQKQKEKEKEKEQEKKQQQQRDDQKKNENLKKEENKEQVQQKLESLQTTYNDLELGIAQPLLRNKWKTSRPYLTENKILDNLEKQEALLITDQSTQNLIDDKSQIQIQAQNQNQNQNTDLINEQKIEDQVILDKVIRVSKKVQKKASKNDQKDIPYISSDQEKIQQQLEILNNKLEELGPSQFMSYIQKKRLDQKNRMQFNRDIMEKQKQIWALEGFVGHLKPHPDFKLNQLFEQADGNLIDMNDPAGRFGQYIPSIQDQINYKLLPAPLVSNPVTKEQQQVINDYLAKSFQTQSEFDVFRNDKNEQWLAQQLLREQALLPQYRQNQQDPFANDFQKQFQPYQSQLSPTQFFYAVNPIHNRHQSYQSLVQQQNPQNNYFNIFLQNPNNPFNIGNQNNNLFPQNQNIFSQPNNQQNGQDNQINIFSKNSQGNQNMIQQPIPNNVFSNNIQNSVSQQGNKPLNIFESKQLFSNNEFNSIGNSNYLKPKSTEIPKTFKDSISPLRTSAAKGIRNQQPIVFKPIDSNKKAQNQLDLSFSKKNYVESPVKLYQQQVRTIYDTVAPKVDNLSQRNLTSLKNYGLR